MAEMSFKQKAMNTATLLLKRSIRLIGGSRATLISAHLAEELAPLVNKETGYGTISFFCPGKMPEWRAQTLLTKEPETIGWINSFGDKDVLWDIGANVGVYSLYAALRNVTVLSFEPSPANYYVLNRNIEVNKMDKRISAFCMAFNDVTQLNSLYMLITELGGAQSSFAEPVNWRGEHFTASFKQAMIGFSVDDFLEQFNPVFPNHIKIDVDGIENKIIKGAKKTLLDKRVKSLLVELDSSREGYCQEVVATIETAGMKFMKKEHAPMFDEGEYSTGYNYIFRRV